MGYFSLFIFALHVLNTISTPTSCGVELQTGVCVKFPIKGLFKHVLIRDYLMETVAFDSDGSFRDYAKGILCRCAKKALEGEYKTFGVHRFLHCYASKISLEMMWSRISGQRDFKCSNDYLESCVNKERCLGGRKNIVIYSLDRISSGCSSVGHWQYVDYINASKPLPSMQITDYCQVLRVVDTASNPRSYILAFSIAKEALNGKFSGFTFNLKDFQNFQYFMFKMGHDFCFTTGLVVNGVVITDPAFYVKRKCLKLKLGHQTWYDVFLRVSNDRVLIAVDHKNVASIKDSPFPIPRGGYLLTNGNYSARYRNFRFW